MELNGINMPKAWGGQELLVVRPDARPRAARPRHERALGCAVAAVQRPRVRNGRAGGGVRAAARSPDARRHAYAITEEGAGSDPSVLQTKAVRDGDGWRITGEKWFVTTGDIADYFIVVADAEGHGLTSFLVDKQLDGVAEKRRPRFMHAFVFEHPEFTFDDVRVRRLEGPRHARRRPRADQGVVHGRAAADRGPLAGRCRALPRRGPRVRLRATPVRVADLSTTRRLRSSSPTPPWSCRRRGR